jgi:hypothetical protein
MFVLAFRKAPTKSTVVLFGFRRKPPDSTSDSAAETNNAGVARVRENKPSYGLEQIARRPIVTDDVGPLSPC